jgi:hypothetical protein
MNVLLSDEKIRSLLCPYKYTCTDCPDDQIISCRKLCEESQRHLLHILKEPCTEHPNIVQGDEEDEVTLGIVYRYQCPECMKQIEKEIEG